MLVPLTFRDKYGFPYQRDAADVLWAETAGQNCILHFENGDAEPYGYPLCDFHKKVWNTNLFRRLDRFLLVKTRSVIRRKWLKAFLSCGIAIELTRSANKKLKHYLAKHPS